MKSVVGWILFSLLATATLAMYLFASEFSNFINVMFIACILNLVLLFYFQKNEILNFIKTSFAKNLFKNSITVFLVICIFSIVNYLSYKNPVSFDLTGNKLHTLTDQSQEVLNKFQDEVKITLYAKRIEWPSYLSTLKLYQSINKKIILNAIDVEENPALVKLNNISENGSVIIEYQGRKVIGKATTELEITNLLLKLIRSKKMKIFYTKGHGEVDFQDISAQGASYLKSRLNEFNYELYSIDLLQSPVIPKEVDAVILIGPKNGLLDQEIDTLKNYLNNGGNLLVTVAPNFEKKDWNNLTNLIKDQGIEVVNSIVLDRLATVQGSQATIPIVNSFNNSHSITKKFNNRILFPLVSAIRTIENSNITVNWLAKTSSFPASWAETTLEELSSARAAFDSKDIQGPITVAAVSSNKENFSKMAVIGSTSMLINSYQSQSANFNFFMNVLTWLIDDEGIISLNRPSLNSERIFLGSYQVTLIFWVCIIFIPFAFFGTAIYFYRRKLQK